MTRADRAAAFRVPVAALRKHPGSRRPFAVAGPIADLANSGSAVVAGSDVTFTGELEATGGAIVVIGTAEATWQGPCRRCLEPAEGRLVAEVRELCSDDPDLEPEYVIGPDFLDLEPVAHDACILELPLAPLCKQDCLGLCPSCGVNRNRETCTCTRELDPRWGALDGLAAADVARGGGGADHE